jgi:hypothetical protein
MLLDTAPRRNRLAIACSIAVHLCAIALLALVPWTVPAVAPDQANRVLPIALERRFRARAALAPAARPQPSAGVTRRQPVAARASTARAPVVHVHTLQTHHDSNQRTSAPAAHVAAPVVPAVSAATIIVPAASSAPRTVLVATTTGGPPAMNAGGGGGDTGLFSATYPPAPSEPSAYDAIRATIGARMRLRLTIDEHGHATALQWLTTPADPSSAEAVRARLMALLYIPALCDGLPCDGVLDIRT